MLNSDDPSWLSKSQEPLTGHAWIIGDDEVARSMRTRLGLVMIQKGADASAIVTYSQSENPNSPWFDDQTRMFSNKEWNGMHFCKAEIERDKVSKQAITSK